MLPLAVAFIDPAGPGHAQQPSDSLGAGPVAVESAGENAAIRLRVRSYEIRAEKRGQTAREGTVFLILRGALVNQSATKRTKIPDVQRAFLLQLTEGVTASLDPVSQETADPFWGPIVLEPGEERTVEMVFAVPDQPLERATLVHLGSAGTISVAVVGRPPASPPTYLAGPLRKGQTELAVERIGFAATVGGKAAPEGWRYLTVKYWFTNLRVAEPFTIDFPAFTLLVEDGHYIFPPVAEPAGLQFGREQIFLAQEPTPGEMAFLAPAETSDLALVHFTSEGSITLDLTPQIPAPPRLETAAGPSAAQDRNKTYTLVASLYGQHPDTDLEPSAQPGQYVIADVELTLQAGDPLTVLNFDPSLGLALRDDIGRVYAPADVREGLDRPLKPVQLWPGQPVRGQVAFRVSPEAKPDRAFTLEILATQPVLILALPSAEEPAVRIGSVPSKEGEAAREEPSLALPAPTAAEQDMGQIEEAPKDRGQVSQTPEVVAATAQPATLQFLTPKPATAGGEVNVAHKNHRAAGITGRNSDRLTDGVADNFGNYAQAGRNEPLTVRFVQPYSLQRVRMRLWDQDGRTYAYLLEGSLDGNAWAVLADRRTGAQRGWQEISFEDRRLQFLRVTGTGSSAQNDDRLYVMELEAYTREPVPDLSRNLASRRLGGSVASTTSSAPDPRFGPARLIDGETARFPWVSAPAPADGALQPQEIVLQFHEGRSAAIGGLILRPGGPGNWDPVKAAPRRAEVWVSDRTAGEGFARLGEFSFTAQPVDQLVLFQPVAARFVKLRLLENGGARQFTLLEVEILEAEVADRKSILEEFFVRPASTAALLSQRNILHSLNGGRVVETSEAGQDPDRLIDGDTRKSEYRVRSFPAEAVFAFLADGEALVEQVNLYSSAPAFSEGLPLKVRISSSLDGADFKPIGPTIILSRDSGWHAIRFEPVRMRFLKVSLLDSYDGSSAGVTELQAIEAATPGYRSLLAVADYPDFRAGPNIALALFGAQVLSVSSSGREDWPVERLIDGRITDEQGFLTESHGWTSAKNPKLPVELVFAFRNRSRARIAGLALNPSNRTGNQGSRGDWYGTPRDRVKAFAVWISDEPDGSWQRIGAPRYLRNVPVRQLFPLERAVEARYLKLELLSNYGGDYLQLGEVEIYEALEDETYRSVLDGAELNIVEPGAGGVLVRFTSQRDDKGYNASQIMDLEKPDPEWSSADDSLPQRFLFGFRESRQALIRQVEIGLPQGIKAEERPRRVKIAASTNRNPLGGYRTIGTYEVDPELACETDPDQRCQVIGFDPPVAARYLELAIVENGGGSHTRLGRVRIIEARKPGYLSVLSYHDPEEAEAAETAAETAVPANQQREIEPNNAPEQATELTLATEVGGAIAPLADVDVFGLNLTGSERQPLSLRLRGEPQIKTFFRLENAGGKKLLDFDPGTAVAEKTFTWQLPVDRYLVYLDQPPSSVVLLFDDSGSMRQSLQGLQQAAMRYIEEKQPYEEMALVKFAGGEFGGGRVDVLQDFTADVDMLRRAIAGKLQAEGGTPLFDGLHKAMELLRDRPGNRAIVLLSDGADSSSRQVYSETWKTIAEAGVRIYTIGLGGGLQSFDRRIGTSPSRMLQSWATATGGRHFFTPSSDELLGLYTRIAEELRAPPAYSLQVTVPSGDGAIRILETGERLVGVSVPDQIMLILDASGSMAAKTPDGSRKIEIARQVMRAVIQSLPGHVSVGLRIYGHRYPKEPKERSCTDSQLVAPLGPVSRKALVEAVNAIDPKGQTPIGLSLKGLARDFGDAPGPKLGILITDGIETCAETPDHPDYPPQVVQQLLSGGMQLQVNVVGFDIDDNPTRVFLENIARLTGGAFFEARNSAELQASLERALRAGFTVFDSLNQPIAEGLVGGPPLRLPEGLYRIDLGVEPPLTISDVVVEVDRETRLALNKEGASVGVDRQLMDVDSLPPILPVKVAEDVRVTALPQIQSGPDPGRSAVPVVPAAPEIPRELADLDPRVRSAVLKARAAADNAQRRQKAASVAADAARKARQQALMVAETAKKAQQRALAAAATAQQAAAAPGAVTLALGERTYRGQDPNQAVSVHGIFTFGNQDRYEGQFRNFRFTGHGVYRWIGQSERKGDRYEGEWRDNTATGHGVYLSSQGRREEGQFQSSKLEGYGVIEWLAGSEWAGDRYAGQFQQGREHGVGVYDYAEGDRYNGEFRQERFNGDGVIDYADGGRYEGQFGDSAFAGDGVMTWGARSALAGHRYAGQWRDNTRDGFGVYRLPNGDRYEGEFRNSMMAGLGLLTYQDGRREAGIWERGRLAKRF